MREIAKVNPLLQGIIDRVDFNATTHGQRDIDDDRLSNLIEAISTKRLGLGDVEADIIGKSYEYLIRKFAEGGGQSAGEFYTPPEVGTIMSRVLQPEPGMTVYDPCCGSGGLLVKCEIAMEEKRSADTPVRHETNGDADRSVRAPFSLYFEEVLEAKVRELNPEFSDAAGALLSSFKHLHSDITGNREFVNFLRNRGKFFDHEEKRERDLMLIDYEDPSRNVYEVTEEWRFHNGQFGTREDVVFLINGIPVLVIECKNADKDEAIALGVDQIRRYHEETPELFVPQQLFTATDAIGFSYGVTWNTVRRNIFNWKTERGHSCPQSPYLDPTQPIHKYKHVLPHWDQNGKWIFVTWRLGDSLPESKLGVWRKERDAWLTEHPKPWDDQTEDAYHRTFTDRIEHWLDQGQGACVLRDETLAHHVADMMLHDDGESVELDCFSVMPNHVHVLFRLLPDVTLDKVMKSWKGVSSRRINQGLGQKGNLWQADFWDRLIRSEKHFYQVRRYILENPEKAGLNEGFLLWERGHSCPHIKNPLKEAETREWEEGGQECPRSVSTPGRLEEKVKSFCAIPNILAFLKDYIVFAEKDEELNKYILRQHQTGGVNAAVERALDSQRTRGLLWHTQGSGKTFTMIKTAEKLFRAPEADKPTVLLMIDRNELEDQMLKNLAALGLGNLEHASSIRRLNELLRDDYRGIIVTMIHKFRDMPADLNTRSNIYVLIDEAHRTTGGDLGNFLMAGLPNATFLGFTGTPVDKTAYGKGTFKTFGCEDDAGYLHKYSIADSIEDGTTLPLYYQLAPNDMLVPHETLESEFLSLAESEGVADIEELNTILERAVNLKNFLKGEERIHKVAQFVAGHYRENVEPLGYKAFLVGVDREACALYKHALDQFLPPEYSEVVYTGNNNDSKLLKQFHLDPKRERQIRKSFGKLDQHPKILIVTEKLLTGFDAPVLYAMYLDKPMRDHTLLQAIARVNRPYENEAEEMVKPHGFVLDFVGIFDKLEKALAFDSEEVNATVKDLKLLKLLFQNKMEKKAPEYLALIEQNFNDKDVDHLIEYFRDPERRKEFFKEYKELEMLYEIISPDAFLRPYIDPYGTLSAIYDVVRKAYAKTVYVDKEFQRKTEKLVREHVSGEYDSSKVSDTYVIGGNTIELVKQAKGGTGTKVINLIKSIQKKAEEESDDPILVGMAERARQVQDGFEQRQQSTAEALDALFDLIQKDELRKQEQAEKGFDTLAYFVFKQLEEAGLPHAEKVTASIREQFKAFSNWRKSEAVYRELRQGVTFALAAEVENLEQVSALVDALFAQLEKTKGG